MYKAFGDVGFGFTKFTDNRGSKPVLRPSIYSEMPTGLNGTELGIFSPFGEFLFGESAQNLSAMTRQFRQYEDCLSDAYAANVLLAISEMNGGNVVDCELVLSLPFEALYLSNELKNRLAGQHKIKRLGYRKQTINITFPKKYGIMSQNAAPVFAKLDIKKITKSGLVWFACGNIGSKTFEQGTFGIDLDSYALRAGTMAQQATEPLGMYTLANDIEPLLLKEFRGQLTAFEQHEIFNILVTNKVEIGNQEIDVSELIRSKKQEYLNKIMDASSKLWSAQNGREILKMYQLTIAGGGAHIVAPYLERVGYHNNIVVSDNPQFDVCVGSQNWHKLIA